MRKIHAKLFIQGQKVNHKAFIFCQAFTKIASFFHLIVFSWLQQFQNFLVFQNRSIGTDFTSLFVFSKVGVKGRFGTKCQGSKMFEYGHVWYQMKALKKASITTELIS